MAVMTTAGILTFNAEKTWAEKLLNSAGRVVEAGCQVEAHDQCAGNGLKGRAHQVDDKFDAPEVDAEATCRGCVVADCG